MSNPYQRPGSAGYDDYRAPGVPGQTDMPSGYADYDDQRSISPYSGYQAAHPYMPYNRGQTFSDVPPEDEEDYAEEELTPEEKKEALKDRLRVLYGLMDFFGVVAGAVLILILIAMLVSLFHFVYNDLGLTAGWLIDAI